MAGSSGQGQLDESRGDYSHEAYRITSLLGNRGVCIIINVLVLSAVEVVSQSYHPANTFLRF